MKTICYAVAMFLVFTYANSCALGQSDTLDFDWDGASVGVTISVSPNIIAVSSPSGDKYTTTVTITGSLNGEPKYNNVEYKYTKTEWMLSINGLNSNIVVLGNQNSGWQNSSTFTVTMYGVDAAKVLIGATATVKLHYEKKDNSSVKETRELSGTKPTNECPTLWIVRITGIDYKVGSMNWEDAGGGIRVPVGSNVSFRVHKNPTDAPSWPSGWPKWTKPDGSTGTGDTTSYTFNTLSVPGGQQFQVKFTCGASTALTNIMVIGVDKLYYYAGGYVAFPNDGTTSAPIWRLYTEKSSGRLFVEASNTMGNHYYWPDKPGPKPVWGGGAAPYDSSPPYQARVSYDGYDSGDTINISAECGNTVSASIVLVGIIEIQFRFAGDADSTYKTLGELVVLKDSKVRFKALPNPTGAKWPTGKPTWSGTAGASGSGETTDVTFSTVSSDEYDFKTIIATCGDPVTRNTYTVAAELDQVTFSNGHAITRDNGTAYATPQWLRGRDAWPIAYTSGTDEVKITTVEYQCNPAKTLTAGVNLSVRGNRSLGNPAQEKTASISGSKIIASNLTCGCFPANKVDYGYFCLEWQLKSTNAQFEWRTVGMSDNKRYVTLGKPINGTPLRETIYELACKNKEATNDGECITNTWASFSGRNVNAWSAPDTFDRTLYYYRTSDGDLVTSAVGMLENLPPPSAPNTRNQGQCGAWADMFHQALRINGVPNNLVLVEPPLPVSGYSNFSHFGVKNIGFSGTSPYTLTDLDPAVAGIPGQNIATPQAKLFILHYVVKAGSSYYDPSYGVTATDETDYSNKAVDALRSGTNWYKRSGITPAPYPVLRFTPF